MTGPVSKSKKMRVDQLLVERGLFDSRSRAQAVVMAGLVFIEGKKIEKAGLQVRTDVALDVRGKDHPWVSRGGLKLDHALNHFALDVTGMAAIDIGSSTGGFSDVLLTRGAQKIFAVDSGTNQLAWKLRQDDRVIVHEQTSARILTDRHITEPLDIAVCDASFISLGKILPVPLGFVRKGGYLVALIKPQFEVQRHEIGKGGVVRDEMLHRKVCDTVVGWLQANQWNVAGVVPSPITGPSGNIEFLVAAQKC